MGKQKSAFGREVTKEELWSEKRVRLIAAHSTSDGAAVPARRMTWRGSAVGDSLAGVYRGATDGSRRRVYTLLTVDPTTDTVVEVDVEGTHDLTRDLKPQPSGTAVRIDTIAIEKGARGKPRPVYQTMLIKEDVKGKPPKS